MAQAMDAIALHPPHGAGVVMRPYRLRAVPLCRLRECFRDAVERLVPADRHESRTADALVADAAQRRAQALRVVLALGVACDLGADDARRVGMVPAAMHAADRALILPLDIERASARAIMRTDRMDEIARQGPS
jgi:hypothetical protein